MTYNVILKKEKEKKKVRFHIEVELSESKSVVSHPPNLGSLDGPVKQSLYVTWEGMALSQSDHDRHIPWVIMSCNADPMHPDEGYSPVRSSKASSCERGLMMHRDHLQSHPVRPASDGDKYVAPIY
ncbi:hypothetical protein CRG98_024056 [Punica granatum]|uniref:Uncharacterized protein n=1 Tax=Punica granatum TaxID=22663 RepID=A0A2I0JIX5_PUNGR|nr:hypothetical protein CRG98_024056 [Punica granatum]